MPAGAPAAVRGLAFLDAVPVLLWADRYRDVLVGSVQSVEAISRDAIRARPEMANDEAFPDGLAGRMSAKLEGESLLLALSSIGIYL